MIELILFWAAALATVVGALCAATLRNLFHSALMLGVSLAGLAGLYLFLDASYLACVQVVVYIGGILVLLLFATLFSADIMGKVQRVSPLVRVTGFGVALLAGVVAFEMNRLTLSRGSELAPSRSKAGPAHDVIAGSHDTIGDLLVGPWLVPFVVAGILLTIALVGAAATVKRYRRPFGAGHG